MMSTMILTNHGLDALASAPSGGYAGASYVVIDTQHATLQNAGTLAIGSTSVTLSANVSRAGDTQIWVGLGTANQELLTFTGTPTLSGSNYVYTLSVATTKTHTNGDFCCRQPTAADTVASIGSEMVADPTYFPNQRLQAVTGYKSGTGVWTMQLYFTGIQANGYIALVGLADSPTIGQGNLHAIGVLGTDHSFAGGGSTNDLEIDSVITLVNG